MIKVIFTNEKEEKPKKSPMKYLTRVVTFCIAFIVVYTIVQLILSYYLEIELSPTLTSCVYTFFGTELAACAFIKIISIIMKAFYKDNEEDSEESPMDYVEDVEG